MHANFLSQYMFIYWKHDVQKDFISIPKWMKKKLWLKNFVKHINVYETICVKKAQNESSSYKLQRRTPYCSCRVYNCHNPRNNVKGIDTCVANSPLNFITKIWWIKSKVCRTGGYKQRPVRSLTYFIVISMGTVYFTPVYD